MDGGTRGVPSSSVSPASYTGFPESKGSDRSASTTPTTFFGRICKFLGIGSSRGAAAPSVRDVKRDPVLGTKLAQKNPRIGSAAQATDSKGTLGFERGRQAAGTREHIADMKFGDLWRTKDPAAKQALDQFIEEVKRSSSSRNMALALIELDKVSSWSIKSTMPKEKAREIAKLIAGAASNGSETREAAEKLASTFSGPGTVQKSKVRQDFKDIRTNIEEVLGSRFRESYCVKRKEEMLQELEPIFEKMSGDGTKPPETFKALWEQRDDFPGFLRFMREDATLERRGETFQFLDSLEAFRNLAKTSGSIAEPDGKAFLELIKGDLNVSGRNRDGMSQLMKTLEDGPYPMSAASLSEMLNACQPSEQQVFGMLDDPYKAISVAYNKSAHGS